MPVLVKVIQTSHFILLSSVTLPLHHCSPFCSNRLFLQASIMNYSIFTQVRYPTLHNTTTCLVNSQR